jgi:hypothetical protein
MRYVTAFLVFFVPLFVACSNDTTDQPGITPPSGVEATATLPPLASLTPSAGASPTATRYPPVDGTVDPLGAGGTDLVTVKGTTDPPTSISTLRDVRIGAHPEEGGWDRIVFEFQDTSPPGEIGYVDAAQACGSGAPVSVQGQAVLAVRFTSVQAHNDAGQPTVRTRELPGPGGAVLEAKQYCDFEGHVDWAVGVKAKQRFKVTRLTNPSRVVIDIKWP